MVGGSRGMRVSSGGILEDSEATEFSEVGGCRGLAVAGSCKVGKRCASASAGCLVSVRVATSSRGSCCTASGRG